MLNSIKKIYKWTKNVLYIMLVILIVILMYHGIKVKIDYDYIPSVIGHTYLNVLSNSMAPEFERFDLVFGKKVQANTEINIGDIITYRDNNILITHRVSNIIDETHFKTKGDSNSFEDEGIVEKQQIVSVVKLVIPNGGYIVAKFQDFTFLVLVWLIFAYAIVCELIKEYKSYKKEKGSKVLS